MKESIKKLVEMGMGVRFHHKCSIDDWYGDIKIYSYDTDFGVAYSVDRPDAHTKRFYDVGMAVDYYIYYAFSSSNIGYLQSRLDKKGLINEDETDLEHPSDEVISLFEAEAKLVDEEFKLFDITLPEFPNEEDAIKELSQIVTLDIHAFREALIEFARKYSVLGVYINFTFIYDKDGHEYPLGISFSGFKPDTFEKDRVEYVHGEAEYKSLFLTVKVGHGEYSKFSLDY